MALIRSPEDAEENARGWMVRHGYPDAELTQPGADGGVDIVSNKAVAQVKAEMKPCGRPVVQQTFGIGAAEKKQPLVFALAGFTPDAVEWAESNKVALLSFDYQGTPEPVTSVAKALVSQRRGDTRTRTSSSRLSVAEPQVGGSAIEGPRRRHWTGYRLKTLFPAGSGDWAQLANSFTVASKPRNKLILYAEDRRGVSYLAQIYPVPGQWEATFAVRWGISRRFQDTFKTLDVESSGWLKWRRDGWNTTLETEPAEPLLHPPPISLDAFWVQFTDEKGILSAIETTLEDQGLEITDLRLVLASPDPTGRFIRS